MDGEAKRIHCTLCGGVICFRLDFGDVLEESCSRLELCDQRTTALECILFFSVGVGSLVLTMRVGSLMLTVRIICGLITIFFFICAGSLMLTMQLVHCHAGSRLTVRICDMFCGTGSLLTERFSTFGLVAVYTGSLLLTDAGTDLGPIVGIIAIFASAGSLLTMRFYIIGLVVVYAGSLLLTGTGTDLGHVFICCGAGSLLTMRIIIIGLMAVYVFFGHVITHSGKTFIHVKTFNGGIVVITAIIPNGWLGVIVPHSYDFDQFVFFFIGVTGLVVAVLHSCGGAPISRGFTVG
jgi:hypothetical protein